MRLAALAAATTILFGPAAAQGPAHYTYVIVHGAWGGAWDWRAVDSMLTRDGHHVVRATLTGLASPSLLAYHKSPHAYR